jgi:hypothetical protein
VQARPRRTNSSTCRRRFLHLSILSKVVLLADLRLGHGDENGLDENSIDTLLILRNCFCAYLLLNLVVMSSHALVNTLQNSIKQTVEVWKLLKPQRNTCSHTAVPSPAHLPTTTANSDRFHPRQLSKPPYPSRHRRPASCPSQNTPPCFLIISKPPHPPSPSPSTCYLGPVFSRSDEPTDRNAPRACLRARLRPI